MWATRYFDPNYWATRYWQIWPEEIIIHRRKEPLSPRVIPPIFIPIFLHKNKIPIIIPIENVGDIENKSVDQMNQYEFERWRRSEGAKHH